MAFYYCFSEKGEVKLPTQEEIKYFHEQGKSVVIFLDSCVCLQIIKVVDYGKQAKNIDFSKILYLKEYISKHPVDISPFFGTLELCTRENTFDERKFWDFKYRIDFFKQIPFKELRKFKYNFDRDFFIIRNIEKPLPIPHQIFDEFLQNSYCALLKIRSLALKGISRKDALPNINNFIEWMSNDLDIFLGTEYTLALYIFGGRTEFRKMIGLDYKEKSIKKNIKGTVWDIFHSKNASNNFRLNQMLQENIHSIFITDDFNLFKIFKNRSLTLIKDGDGQVNTSFLFNASFDYPHFDESFIDYQNERLLNLFIDRRNRKYKFNQDKVNNMIRELETENGIEYI